MAHQNSPFSGLEVKDNPVLEVSAQEQTLQQELDLHMQHFHTLPEDCDEFEKARLELDLIEHQSNKAETEPGSNTQ